MTICFCEILSSKFQNLFPDSPVKYEENVNKYFLYIKENVWIEIKYCYVCGWNLSDNFEEWIKLNDLNSEAIFYLRYESQNMQRLCLCEFKEKYVNKSNIREEPPQGEFNLFTKESMHCIYYCPDCGGKL